MAKGTTRTGSRRLRNPRHERAAELLAADELTDEQIARSVGVCRRTLAYWKKDPAFAARVDFHGDRMVEAWRAGDEAQRRALGARLAAVTALRAAIESRHIAAYRGSFAAPSTDLDVLAIAQNEKK